VGSRAPTASLYVLREPRFLTKEDYLAMLQSPDARSAVAKIAGKGIGDSLSSFLERKRRATLNELARAVDSYYSNELHALTLFNSRYTAILNELLDSHSAAYYSLCKRVAERPCPLYLSAGMYRAWLGGGEEGVALYTSKTPHLASIFSKVSERGKVSLRQVAFFFKPIWEKIAVESSAPARRAIGMFHDILLAKLAAALGDVERDSIFASLFSRDEVAAMARGLIENRPDAFQVADRHVDGFSATYQEARKFLPAGAAIDVSLLLSVDKLSSDLFADPDELALRKYLYLLREAFLVRLVLFAIFSQLDKSEIASLISRRIR